MGELQAEEMVSLLQRDQALQWHLHYNHYPPISLAFIPVAKEAIERANIGDWDYVIEMPNGRKLPVSGIVEGLHLESFLKSSLETE